jgi:hypothetical protein
VVATCYLLGVSTRRMNKLVQSLGVTGLSKSQGSVMARDLDAHVEEFRTRPLAEAGPFTFVAADALVLKVREGGRVVPVHALVATGINADGHREILGIQVTTSEDGVNSWARLARLLPRPDRPRPVRGPAGDQRRPRRTRRRHRSDPARRRLATLPHPLRLQPDERDPQVLLGWVKALLHSVYDQPDAESVHAQFDRILDALEGKLPTVGTVLGSELASAHQDSGQSVSVVSEYPGPSNSVAI